MANLLQFQKSHVTQIEKYGQNRKVLISSQVATKTSE